MLKAAKGGGVGTPIRWARRLMDQVLLGNVWGPQLDACPRKRGHRALWRQRHRAPVGVSALAGYDRWREWFGRPAKPFNQHTLSDHPILASWSGACQGCAVPPILPSLRLTAQRQQNRLPRPRFAALTGVRESSLGRIADYQKPVCRILGRSADAPGLPVNVPDMLDPACRPDLVINQDDG